MEIFDFPYHTYETENPDSSVRVQLGGSYVFTSPPSDPDQRIITLKFPMMKYYLDPTTDEVDPTIEPSLNMFRLIQFYQNHKLFKSFQYLHPIHGMLEVRFNKPLPEPQGIKGGDGAVESFDVVLVEQP